MAAHYKRKDHLHQKAKSEGFRSRAAYKLLELDDKYRFLKPGNKVLDLGAWPGGWLQVAAQRIGLNGVVVGVDLTPIEDLGLPNVSLVTGDIRDEAVIAKLVSALKGSPQVILSDMSPKLTGIPEVDRAAAQSLYECALAIAVKILATAGTLVVKVFKSNEAETFVKSLRPLFNKVLRSELDSSRSTSQEFYVVGLGYVQQSS